MVRELIAANLSIRFEPKLTAYLLVLQLIFYISSALANSKTVEFFLGPITNNDRTSLSYTSFVVSIHYNLGLNCVSVKD